MEQLLLSVLSQWTLLEKSGYGPKGAKLYSPAENVRRKAANVGIERFGNQSVKSYTRRAVEHKEPKGAASKVKIYTPEEIKAHQEKLKIAKNGQWTLE